MKFIVSRQPTNAATHTIGGVAFKPLGIGASLTNWVAGTSLDLSTIGQGLAQAEVDEVGRVTGKYLVSHVLHC